MRRTPNCRLFIGNLASERTSKTHLRSIFSKYGEIIEDPVIRRCFGFVQFDNPESAQQAIQNENGRLIGNMKIECSLADNREPKYKSGQRTETRRQDRRDRVAPYPDRGRRESRRRSRTPPRVQRHDHENIPKCQIVYSHSNEEDIVHRTQNILKDQGINVDNKIFQSPNSRDPIDPVEDSYRRNIPFLLFVNRGGPYIYDVQVILPVSSATTYKSVSLEDSINIMKDYNSKGGQETDRRDFPPPQVLYPPHDRKHPTGWNESNQYPPGYGREPYNTGNQGNPVPTVGGLPNNYFPPQNPYNPSSGDRFPSHPPPSGNQSYQRFSGPSSSETFSEPNSIYNPSQSYYSPKPDPLRDLKDMNVNTATSYPPEYPPRENNSVSSYYDKVQGYQSQSASVSRPTSQTSNQQPMDPQQLANLVWLLQSQQGAPNPEIHANINYTSSTMHPSVPTRTLTTGPQQTIHAPRGRDNITDPRVANSPNLSTEELLQQQLLLQRGVNQPR